MALYFYRAFSRDGKKTSGYIDAPSQQVVKERLGQQGLFPTEIQLSQEGAATGFNWRSWFTPSITVKEKILFWKRVKFPVWFIENFIIICAITISGVKIFLTIKKIQIIHSRVDRVFWVIRNSLHF